MTSLKVWGENKKIKPSRLLTWKEAKRDENVRKKSGSDEITFVLREKENDIHVENRKILMHQEINVQHYHAEAVRNRDHITDAPGILTMLTDDEIKIQKKRQGEQNKEINCTKLANGGGSCL